MPVPKTSAGCGKALTVPGEAEWKLMQEAESPGWIRPAISQSGGFSTSGGGGVAKGALDEAGIPYLEEDFLSNPYDGRHGHPVRLGPHSPARAGRGTGESDHRRGLKPCPLDEAEDDAKDDETEPEGSENERRTAGQDGKAWKGPFDK